VSALARPAVLAALLAGAALCLHPALRTETWLPERELVLATLLLSCAVALVARASAATGSERVSAWAIAVGALVTLAGLGLDGLRGRHGTLALSVGQSRNHFDEIGPSGQPLGLRPLGFSIGVERVSASGGVALAAPGRSSPVEISAGRAAAVAGFRFARPRASATGGVAHLRVSASDGTRTDVADLAPREPGRAGDVVISLDEYFPDFALDEKRQPFTRSLEPRNPAALLTVARGGQAYRAFVIQAMPGVHRVEPLGLTFSLLDVEPEQQVELAVHREPFAPAVLLGGVLLALGIGLAAIRSPHPAAGSDARSVILSGCVLVSTLLLVDSAHLLTWSFGVSGSPGRLVLPGVGVPLGLALLAAAAGTAWLAAGVAAGSSGPPVALGRGALWLAVAMGVAGIALGIVRVAMLSEPSWLAALPLIGVGAASGLVALLLHASGTRTRPDVLVPVVRAVAGIAVAAAVGLGAMGLSEAGTYSASPALAALAAALLGLCALQPARAAGLRRFALLASATALLVRPL
jgi:hypothetical protein